MRSSEPMPGNPWPHDMTIRVEEPYGLVYLLFVRQAWHLEIAEVPDVDPRPETGSSMRPSGIDAAAANRRWRDEWKRAWAPFDPRDRTVREPDAETARLLRELSDAELVDAVTMMPSAYWADSTDLDAFHAWSMSLHDDQMLPLERHPERRSLDALIVAWRTGLTTIIPLPYAGYHAERINRETLVVSRSTRQDPILFSRALGTPPESPS